MRVALVASIVLSPADPTEVVVDLFTPKETPLSSLEKRPRTDDPEVARLETRKIEEQ